LAIIIHQFTQWRLAYLAAVFYGFAGVLVLGLLGIYTRVINLAVFFRIKKFPKWNVGQLFYGLFLFLLIPIYEFVLSPNIKHLITDIPSLRISLLGLASVILLDKLFECSEPIILQPLRDIRRKLALGLITVVDATQEASLILAGIPEALLVRKNILAAYKALSTVHTEMHAFRTALETEGSKLSKESVARFKQSLASIQTNIQQFQDLPKIFVKEMPWHYLLGGEEARNYFQAELDKYKSVQIMTKSFQEDTAVIKSLAASLKLNLKAPGT
jgi:hypothetical protein